MTERIRVVPVVNGRPCPAEVEPRLLLVDFLRDYAGCKAVRVGCDTSNCGACTVLLDGESVKACTVLAVQADGRTILTLEGLARDGRMHPLQEAFVEAGAFQCGYCTPGMIMAALDLLRRNPNPTRDQVREGLVGNLCRCTGYAPIIDAVLLAAERLRGADPLAGEVLG